MNVKINSLYICVNDMEKFVYPFAFTTGMKIKNQN